MPPEPIGLDKRGSGRARPDIYQANEGDDSGSNSACDRDFQDHIICFLADANFRSTNADSRFLDERDAERAERFSKFLARRYYRDRLQRAFRYSARLVAPSSGPGTIADSAQFESFLTRCVLGSLGSAKDVGRLTVAQLTPQREESWWSELLEYEFAFFLQLATSESVRPTSFPIKNSSTLLHRFHVRIPELLLHLRGERIDSANIAGDATLLFSRTHHGKIYVVELDENTAAVFAAVVERRSVPEMANAIALPVEEIQRILVALSDIGAVVPPAEVKPESTV